MPDEKYPPGPSSGSSTAPLLPVTRKRSSSTSSEESASGANGRARSSSYGEAGLKQSPKVLVHQLLARVKRRPLPWGFGFVVLLWASWLVGRSATRGRLADWRSGQGKLDGMQDDALLEEGSVYSASEGLYRLDKDPTKYVKPTREELQRYIGEDPKWLVKDNGAGYGYNNVRYCFEATMNIARILGRIPVIPDTSWARKCAVDSETCTKYAREHLAHRNDGSRPIAWNEDGEAWMLGMEDLLDIPRLRRTYGKVITVSEYFTLYDLDPSLYEYSGSWNPETYTPAGMTTEVFDRTDFNHDKDSIRVDRPPKELVELESAGERTVSAQMVAKAMRRKLIWSMYEARAGLEKLHAMLPEEESSFIAVMESAGSLPLYTFHNDLTMSKALALPVIEFTPRKFARPLSTELSMGKYADASIIHIPGDVHDQRKAGALRFTSPEGRQEFVDFVIQGVRPPRRYIDMGNKLAARMTEKVGGRAWLGAHMRRGDFLGIHWSPDVDAVGHFNKTRVALAQGLQALESYGLGEDQLPRSDDPFYLATDEEDPASLDFYRSSGAVLLSDLMTSADAEELGWQSSFTDLLAFVEQEILASSAFFVGSKLSSTTGGILNMRQGRGKGKWSFSLLESN